MNVTTVPETDEPVSVRSPGARGIVNAMLPVNPSRSSVAVSCWSPFWFAVGDDAVRGPSATSYGARFTDPALSEPSVSTYPVAAAVMVAVPAPWRVSVKPGVVSEAGRVTVLVGAPPSTNCAPVTV